MSVLCVTWLVRTVCIHLHFVYALYAERWLFQQLQCDVWEYYQGCRYDRHTALELTSWNCILLAVSNMRPVTLLPPGHANRDWGISVRCHYQRCTLVRVFVFLSICFRRVIGWFSCRGRVLHNFNHSALLLSPSLSPSSILLLSLFSSFHPSFCPIFSVTASFHLHFVLAPPLPPSFSYLAPYLSSSPLFPSPCQHCRSLGSPSVYYRPLTTSSLYGTFSF